MSSEALLDPAGKLGDHGVFQPFPNDSGAYYEDDTVHDIRITVDCIRGFGDIPQVTLSAFFDSDCSGSEVLLIDILRKTITGDMMYPHEEISALELLKRQIDDLISTLKETS